jgi:hypothetical protein
VAKLIAFCFFYKRKIAITNIKVKVALWKDLLVLLIFVLTTAIFICFVDINSAKIFAERKAKHPTKHPVKQNSLESKIRDWWNNR